jgi:hypothetical protein
MMRLKSLSALSFGILALALLAPTQDRIVFKTIDGVPHVLNPSRPLHGSITLEVERTRTINPYDQPDVGLRSVSFTRRETGEVILYDRNGSEAHWFGSDGKYLGLLTKKGQGPGEFSPFSFYQVCFLGPDIWVYGSRKVARFDGRGRFLGERKLQNRCSLSLEPGRFLALETKRDDPKTQIGVLKDVTFSMEGAETGIELLRAENIGEIRSADGRSGFSEPWGTPSFFFAASRDGGRIYCGLNTKYLIRVKDLAGKDALIIQREYENIKVKRSEVEKLIPWALKGEGMKWALSAYPDRYAAIRDVAALPKGYLAVYRITGSEVFEIDVFNPKGEYIYALVPPAGVKMEDAQFFAAGFATVEQEGDYTVYREYRIKNLPEIFGK